LIDPNGVIHEVYGRKIRDDLRAGTAYHLYLPGAHAGVWNEEGLQASGGEVILCEALIDAMTFWGHGFRNVTASYGVNGFTSDHLAALQRHGVHRVLTAYDRDDAGNAAAVALAEQLTAAGIACFRIQFPKGMDANEYALKMSPPATALALLIRKAEWLGDGRASALTSAPADGLPALDSAVLAVATSSLAPEQAEPSLAAKEKTDSPLAADLPAELPEPLASPLPPAPQIDTPIE
jgi:DNA primase